MNNKRTGKFYRKNEADVIKSLGLIPTKGSGSGPLEKEDGYNDTIICQLKSTDAESISIKQHDLHTLIYNSVVSHKTPVFAIQFLNTGEVWIMAKPEDLSLVYKGMGEKRGMPDPVIGVGMGSQKENFTATLIVDGEETDQKKVDPEKCRILSSPDGRKKFFAQQQEGWKKK